MQPARIEGQPHRLPAIELGLGVDPADQKRDAAHLNVGEQLGAELLGHLDAALDRALGRRLAVDQRDVLGPHAERDPLIGIAGERRAPRLGHAQAHPVAPQVDRIALSRHAYLEEVHRRRADEAGDEARDRPGVDLPRRADLLHQAVAHDHHPVTQCHRLDLIVGDVD